MNNTYSQDLLKKKIINETARNIQKERCIMTGLNTCIHNWPLQPFSQDYDLASDTIHVACVNFIRGCRDLQQQFKSTSNSRFLRNFFMAGLFTEFSPEICWEEIVEEISFFHIFRCDAWPGIQTRALRVISQYSICYTTATSINSWPKYMGCMQQ